MAGCTAVPKNRVLRAPSMRVRAMSDGLGRLVSRTQGTSTRTYAQRWEGEERGFEPMPRTEGLLVHRLQIKRLRIIQPVPKTPPAKTPESREDDDATAGAEEQ